MFLQKEIYFLYKAKDTEEAVLHSTRWFSSRHHANPSACLLAEQRYAHYQHT